MPEISTQLGDSQRNTIAIAPMDKAKNAAKVDGAPAWSSSDLALVTVSPAADGLSGGFEAVGPLGTADIVIEADANMDPNIADVIRQVIHVEIVAGGAISMGTTIGVPEEKP